MKNCVKAVCVSCEKCPARVASASRSLRCHAVAEGRPGGKSIHTKPLHEDGGVHLFCRDMRRADSQKSNHSECHRANKQHNTSRRRNRDRFQNNSGSAVFYCELFVYSRQLLRNGVFFLLVCNFRSLYILCVILTFIHALPQATQINIAEFTEFMFQTQIFYLTTLRNFNIIYQDIGRRCFFGLRIFENI